MACKEALDRLKVMKEEAIMKAKENNKKRREEGQCIVFRICPECGADLKEIQAYWFKIVWFKIKLNKKNLKCIKCDYLYTGFYYD